MFNRAGAALAMVLWLARSAAAGESIGVLDSGDCREPDLRQGSRLLVSELSSRLGAQLLAHEGLKRRLAEVAESSAEDLSRRVDAAQTLFYNGEHARAAEALEPTVRQILRLPPGEDRWGLQLRAELLAGQVFRRAGRPESDDFFRHVLRLNPSHRLDPDYFTPTIRAHFDRLRAELAAEQKGRFEVRSTPSGADVYLDGLKVGTTPAAFDAAPARYDVVVVKDGVRSFPHALTPSGPSLTIDLAFEGAVDLEREPCFAAASPDEAARLAGAMRVATVVGVDRMVVVHLAKGATGMPRLGASVLDVRTAQKLRYGEVQLAAEPDLAAGPVAELARFIVTGEKSQRLIAVSVLPPRVAQGRSDAPARATALAELAPAFFPGAAPGPAGPRLPLPSGWRGAAVLALGGGGAFAVVVGGVSLSMANRAMEATNAYFLAGPVDAALLAQVGPMREAARAQQAAAVAGLCAGALALAASGALWIAGAAR